MTPCCSLASATLFALGRALQHRSAGSAFSSSKRRIAATLLRRPGWMLGAALCATAFGLHASALARGDLTVVQPVILTGIIFAVFARAAIEGRRPGRREMLWAVVTWAGLALVIALLNTGAPRPPDLMEAVSMWRRRRHGRRGGPAGSPCPGPRLARRVLLATGAAVLFGLVAGLVKLSLDEVDGLADLLTRWSTWAVVVLGAWAILTNQRAYQSTRLSFSSPVLNLCQLAVSWGSGWRSSTSAWSPHRPGSSESPGSRADGARCAPAGQHRTRNAEPTSEATRPGRHPGCLDWAEMVTTAGR